MIAELTLVLTAFGLGAWIPVESGTRRHGISLYAGFCLIPLLLFLLMGAGGFSLTFACRSVAVIAFCGLFRSMFRVRWRSLIPFLMHPGFVLIALSLLLTETIFHQGYPARIWDEFTYWLMMPRQILGTGELPSRLMEYKGFVDYTPGWPLLIAYIPSLTGTGWDQMPFLYLPLFSGIAFLALVYDAGSQMSGECQRPVSTTGWSAVFLVLFLGGAEWFAPQFMLIEAPLIHCMAALMVMILLLGARGEGSLKSWIPVSVVLAAAYFFKKPAGVFFPAVIVFFLIPFTGQPLKSRLKQAVTVLFPVMFLLIVWKVLSSESSKGMDLFSFFAGLFSHVTSPEGSDLAGRFSKRTLDYVFNFSFREAVLFVMAAGGMLAALFSREMRRWGVFAGLFTILYLSGLYVLYAVVYGDFLSSQLASFVRYMDVFLTPLGIAGGLLIVVRLFAMKVFGKFRMSAAALLLMIVTACFFSVQVLGREPGKFDRGVIQMREQSKRITEIYEEKNLRGEKIFMLLQRKSPLPVFVSRYESYHPATGLSYRLGRAPYWVPSEEDAPDKGPRSTPAGRAFIANKMREAPLIWVYRSDAYTRPILRRLAGSCVVSRREPYLLVKEKNEKYRCEAF